MQMLYADLNRFSGRGGGEVNVDFKPSTVTITHLAAKCDHTKAYKAIGENCKIR